ncbi:hypothetical protein D3C87_1969890 [compost metagenome]
MDDAVIGLAEFPLRNTGYQGGDPDAQHENQVCHKRDDDGAPGQSQPVKLVQNIHQDKGEGVNKNRRGSDEVQCGNLNRFDATQG